MKNLETKNRKARKTHRCGLCGEEIKEGDVYEDQTNVCDGEIYSFKSHVDCTELAIELDMFDDVGHDEGLNEDCFCENIKEAFFSLLGSGPQEHNNYKFHVMMRIVKKYYLNK